jgi:hypothetical protein
MKKICPDCGVVAELDPDSPASRIEFMLESTRMIRVKRCRECNAAVFTVLGLYPATRRSLYLMKQKSYWATLAVMALVTGYVIIQSMLG